MQFSKKNKNKNSKVQTEKIEDDDDDYFLNFFFSKRKRFFFSPYFLLSKFKI